MPILYHKTPVDPSQQAINNTKKPFYNGSAGSCPQRVHSLIGLAETRSADTIVVVERNHPCALLLWNNRYGTVAPDYPPCFRQVGGTPSRLNQCLDMSLAVPDFHNLADLIQRVHFIDGHPDLDCRDQERQTGSKHPRLREECQTLSILPHSPHYGNGDQADEKRSHDKTTTETDKYRYHDHGVFLSPGTFGVFMRRQSAARSQRAETRSALIVCMRFSDSSKTLEYFDSNTSSVTSRAPHSLVTSVLKSWNAGRQ